MTWKNSKYDRELLAISPRKPLIYLDVIVFSILDLVAQMGRPQHRDGAFDSDCYQQLEEAGAAGGVEPESQGRERRPRARRRLRSDRRIYAR
jgi:hypothetical protein